MGTGHSEVDLSPETICGTVIDTQETLIQGKEPNEHQIRACKLANASESLLTALHELLKAIPPQSADHGAGIRAFELLKTLPEPKAR